MPGGVWQAVLLGAACAFALLAVELDDILHAVLALLAMSVCVAGLFWLLSAPLLAVFQLLIYGGAIVALFIVTVTLTGARARRPTSGSRDPVWAIGAIVCVALLVLLHILVQRRPFQTLDYAQLSPKYAPAVPSIVIRQVSEFLWQFRGPDLIAQGFVSLGAALGCIALLRPRHKEGS